MPVLHEQLDDLMAITLDDGKVNALTLAMLDELDALVCEAARDGSLVVLAGRPGVLSAGFDLAQLQAGGDGAVQLVRRGFEVAMRLLAHPRPVAIACTGHAIAMGSFLLLSGDVRIGAIGPWRIAANEVAIGLTMPQPAIALLRSRLNPVAFDRVTLLAEVQDPAAAVAAGFLDRLVDPGDVVAATIAAAHELATLDPTAHANTKQRARAALLAEMQAGLDVDFVGAR